MKLPNVNHQRDAYRSTWYLGKFRVAVLDLALGYAQSLLTMTNHLFCFLRLVGKLTSFY